MSTDSTDCRSPEGISTGLVDSIITSIRVLKRHYPDALPAEALEDLAQDPEFAWLLEELRTYSTKCMSCGQPGGYGYRCDSCGMN